MLHQMYVVIIIISDHKVKNESRLMNHCDLFSSVFTLIALVVSSFWGEKKHKSKDPTKGSNSSKPSLLGFLCSGLHTSFGLERGSPAGKSAPGLSWCSNSKEKHCEEEKDRSGNPHRCRAFPNCCTRSNSSSSRMSNKPPWPGLWQKNKIILYQFNRYVQMEF